MKETDQELLQEVLDARSKVSEIDGLLKEAKQVKITAEAKLIERMDDTEKKMFKSALFPCVVTRKETLYVSIAPENKDEALRYIEEDCGRGDIVKKSVHNKTLSSFVGNRLKEAEAVPQELFTYFWKPELSIRMSG